MQKPERISGITVLLAQGMFCWAIWLQMGDKASDRNPMRLSVRMDEGDERDDLVLLLATLIGG